MKDIRQVIKILASKIMVMLDGLLHLEDKIISKKKATGGDKG